jgi:hypothetical protein
MREHLLKFEDFNFSKMNFSQNMNFKALILKDTSKYFGIFNGIKHFSNEEFDSSNDNEIDFDNYLKSITKFKLRKTKWDLESYILNKEN